MKAGKFVSSRPALLAVKIAVLAAALCGALPARSAPPVVGLWRFNEGSGTNAADSSGLGNSGTLQGENGNVPAWVAGKPGFGGALRFTNDGADHAYVNVPGNPSLQIGQTATDPWTITAWAYEDSDSTSNYVSSYGRIMVIDDGTALQLESGADGDPTFYTWARANSAWQIGWTEPDVAPLLDQWEHWAVVYDGTNLSVYLNGGQTPNGGFADTPVTAALGYAGYQGAIHIGTELGQDGTRQWNGMLDDIAVFSGALTSNEIQTVMAGDFSGFIGGPAHILSQPQNQTAPQGSSAIFAVGGSGQTPLQYQWYRNTAALSGQTNSTLVLTNVQFAQDGSYAVSVSNALGGAISQPATLFVYSANTKLVGLWRFNEGSGTNAADSSGLGNNGVLRGENGNIPGWAPGQPGFGTALSVTNDGADHAYVDIPGNTSLMIGQTATNPWTITAWAYEKSDGSDESVSAYGRILVIDDGTALQLESGAPGDEQFYTWARANAAWQLGWDGALPLQFDTWEHWAVVYDGNTNLTIYLNGGAGPNSAVASMAVTAPLGYPGYQGAVHIGSELGAPADRTWDGYLDDVAEFTVPLTQAQIQTVMGGDFSQFLSGPSLAISLQPGGAVLSWPAGSGSFQLQSVTNLSQLQWSNITTAPVTNNGAATVSVPLSSGNQFFRLAAPGQ